MLVKHSKATYFHGWNPTHNNGKFKAGGSYSFLPLPTSMDFTTPNIDGHYGFIFTYINIFIYEL